MPKINWHLVIANRMKKIITLTLLPKLKGAALTP